jgi:hypothetical protein
VVESQYLGAAGDNAAWGSPDKAKEIALSWYNDGADVVYTAAGGSGRGTIEAAVEAGDGKWAIGVDSRRVQLRHPRAEGPPPDLDAQAGRRCRRTRWRRTSRTAPPPAASTPFNLANDGVGYATTCGNLDDIVRPTRGLQEADRRRATSSSRPLPDRTPRALRGASEPVTPMSPGFGPGSSRHGGPDLWAPSARNDIRMGAQR